MKPHVSAITIGVSDLDRAKKFYEGLGWPIEQDHGVFVSFAADEGSSALSLYSREGLADDAGVPPQAAGSPASPSRTSSAQRRPSTPSWPMRNVAAARS